MNHPSMAVERARAGGARDRDAALPISVHGEGRAGGPIRRGSRMPRCARRSAEAAQLAPDLPLFAGGRSFGGRMTSQAQAIAPLPGVRGLAFLGFPLHPAGKPGIERADISRRCKSRCCSCRARAMRWRSWTAEAGGRRPWRARARSTSSTQPTTAFKVPAKSGRTPTEARGRSARRDGRMDDRLS